MSDNDKSSAIIQRKIVKSGYEKAGKPYLINSRPYESTLPVRFDYVAGTAFVAGDGSLGTGFLVARANQTLEFFGYGRGANQGGALADDTNIVAARKTNASEDFVIEGMSMTHRSTRFVYSAGNIGKLSATAQADVDIAGAFGNGAAVNGSGNAPVLFDPSAMHVPLVVQSPVNLEDGMYGAVAPHLALELVWGGKRTEPVGCLDNVPEGAAKSLLRASGLPSVDNRMKIPEGYLWRKSGSDEDLIARATLVRAIVIPVTNVRFPGEAVATAGSPPIAVFVDLKLRLHGVAFGFPSRN